MIADSSLGQHLLLQFRCQAYQLLKRQGKEFFLWRFRSVKHLLAKVDSAYLIAYLLADLLALPVRGTHCAAVIQLGLTPSLVTLAFYLGLRQHR